ncbi:uncharacterized protein LOC135162389 isoform X5 [Diachasmimorpha longicaudata]|uniref:uncharacterized protein LOC135162389 isoform X5 n=1 Tax=Diachasmimorpha longicaudata TaxID=58733 RepID=UPI0030B8B04D
MQPELRSKPNSSQCFSLLVFLLCDNKWALEIFLFIRLRGYFFFLLSVVNPGSKASQQGVREGDLISSINGRNTRDLTNSEAHTLLRNAGDQLKLGLNQESVGSPKRRIYKSSLQENTSIETIQKTTRTITTATCVQSSGTRNGTDDTKHERDFPTQNGNLKPRNDNTTDKVNEIPKKTTAGATSSKILEIPSRMPQSRSRRHRRNKNKRPNQLANHESPLSSHPAPMDDANSRQNPCEITEDSDGIIEAKVNGQAVKVTTEVTETALGHGMGSIPRQHTPVRRRYKLERHALTAHPKICEITDISDLRMEAYVGHVAGVGIIESCINDASDIRTIVTEPVEPLGPLSSDVTSRLETLGERDFALALLPNANRDRPEIHEVNDSDAETTELNRGDVVSEAELDIEIAPRKNETILEKTGESESTDKENLSTELPKDQQKLPCLSFSSASSSQVSKNAGNKRNLSPLAIISEPESDIDQPKSIIDQIILEETEEESDFSDKPSSSIMKLNISQCKPTSLPETSSSGTINKDLASSYFPTLTKHPSLSSEDADSERTIIDSKPESETEGEDNINTKEEEFHNVTESKESTKCTDDSNETTIDLNSKEFTGASSVIEIENGIETSLEIHEPQLTRQFDDKLRIFIKECDLEKRQSDDNNLLNHKCHVNETEACNSVIREYSERVETQENHRYEKTPVDRYLDIIQEEGECLAPHDRDIRDFINEEIGKFRREIRKTDVNEEVTETRNNETIMSSRNENISGNKTENEKGHDNKMCEETGSPVNQVNEEELDSIKRRFPPAPPRRSSSFNSMDVDKITGGLCGDVNSPTSSKPPQVPDLPIEVIKILTETNEHFHFETSPVRPPLPKNFNSNDAISHNVEHHHNEGVSPITPRLRNTVDAGKFGNDDSVEALTKITHDHIDNISDEVLGKNTKAFSKSTPMVDSTVSPSIEVKCSRPRRNKLSDIKEKVPLETLKRECIHNTQVKSSDIVHEIKELCSEYKKSVDLEIKEMKSSETKIEKTEISYKSESTETHKNISTDSTEFIGTDDQCQESSSSTPSPATVKHVSDEEEPSSKPPQPNPLKDLCIKKILSLPYGRQLINEITLPKFTIFKNLESIHKIAKTLQIHESKDLNTMKKRPTTWMGVPTEDPHLLVCLSPSQQETPVRTSADKLLDLHKKFLNRCSYHHDHRAEINVPKYHIDITPTSTHHPHESIKPWEKELKQLEDVSVATNRLLEIVKENPIPMDLPSVTKPHKNVEQNPLKSTLVAKWLTESNNDHLNTPVGETTPSCHFSQRLRYQENEKTRASAFSPVPDNDHITSNDTADIRSKRGGRIFNTTISSSPTSSRNFNETTNRINSALILRTPEGTHQEHRSTTPINRSPITNRSAIIDRTSDIAEPRKWTLSRTIDARQVNPALINDRPEAPPRRRRTVDVDRTCIDTTSIFDKTPPRGHLEERKCHDPETLKQATASEIVENLKDLQRGVKDMFDGRRRYSLPQEYFDKQLEYIETLENQLKEVIIAEEEEEKAFVEFEGQVRKMEILNGNKMETPDRQQLSNDGNNFRQTWHEESRVEDNSRTEFTSKGQKEKSTERLNQTESQDLESSMNTFENKEVNQVTTYSESRQKWKRYVDDISRDSLDGEKRDHHEVDGKSERPKSIWLLPSCDEVFRRKMYDEYVHKVLEREERKQHKVIKIRSGLDLKQERSKDNMNTMEKEFIEKAKKRLNKFGIELDEHHGNDEVEGKETSTTIEAKCLIDGKEIKDAKKLPKHLQEFIELTINELEDGYGYGMDAGGKTNDNDLLHEIDTALRDSKGFLLREGVWSPGSEAPPPSLSQPSPDRGKNTDKDGGIPPVWTPSSAGASPVVERKEFRPVSFESPILSRRNPQTQSSTEEIPPWQQADDKKEASQSITQNITTRIVNSHSVPSQGLNTLANPPRLPRAQNPTITLLQKAREGQLPKGAAYLEATVEKSHEGARVSPGEIIYTVKREYESEPECEREQPKKMADLGRRKILGIGPITKDGMPVALRSEVKDTNQAKWYKQMYDSLHRAGRNDDYVTIRYKPRRGTRYGCGTASGYLSEPEPRVSVDRSATLDTRRRQRNKENDITTSTMPRKSALVKTTAEVYRNQPGRIENYQPGRSSISEKETKEWWDEVMDIFDGPFDQRNPHAAKPYMSHALKESGYESDSTLIFRRRDDASPLSPLEQRLAYKTVQKGGDVPLHGLRKPAPERPKDDAEIEYFPISRTLTRIRVRRRTLSNSMSSMTLDRHRRSTPSSTIVPSRANLITTYPHKSPGRVSQSITSVPRQRTTSPNCPPSPPRRLSSRHSVTLKLYASSYSHPPNPRHEQCFNAEATSNIRFLRERLSNKLLKHEQGRAPRTSTIPRASSASPSSPYRPKLQRSTLPKRKSEPCLLKKSESDKSIRVAKSSTLSRTIEFKPPVGKLTKPAISTEPSRQIRANSSPPAIKRDQKLRRCKKDTDETLKRASSTDLSSSPVEVRRLRRQVDPSNALTGSVIRSNSSLSRVKSQDSGLSKVISKSRDNQRTTGVTQTLRSFSPVSSTSGKTITETFRQKSLTAKGRDKFTSVQQPLLPTTIVCDPNTCKKGSDKPHTIVKSPSKKPEPFVITKNVEKKKNMKNSKVKSSKTKKTPGKLDDDKKRGKKISGISTESIKSEPKLTMERIKQHTEATRTEHFFQNLFLRNGPSPTPSQSSTLRRSSVLERARMFQEFGTDSYKSEPSLRSLNVYLSTKRPVSTSRFRHWEDSVSSRSSSPYGVTWPGRSPFQKISKFDSLIGMDEFGSTASLRGRSPELNKEGLKERSLSEPPIKVSSVSEVSCNVMIPSISQSSSSSPTRSAACRRIRSLKQDRSDFPPLKVRAKSASEADDCERRKNTFGSNLSLAKSTSSLESPPINKAEYQRYLYEVLHSKKKSSRYKELHDFYASLERMGELVKTTSTSDIRRRFKNEEIIDYDRWREIRAKERAEQELKNLYGKLKDVQREKDFLFSTKDVESCRWRGDCGLRCKERSVDNIRESFHRLAKEESELETTRRRDIASKKDVYKPLWRGNSVVNVASNMTKKANGETEIDKCIQPTLQKSLGGSNKFWSSLSVEQVNTLKNQLNEIYGTENGKKGGGKDEEDKCDQIDTCDEIKQTVQTVTQSQYEVVVPEEFGEGIEDTKGLHVRCHSMLMSDIRASSETKLTSSLKRSGSISNGRSLDRLRTDKSNLLSEAEKKRLSLTLGKEILQKMSKRGELMSPVTPRETRGAIAVASAKNHSQSSATNSTSPRTCYSLETSLDEDGFKAKEKSDFLLVLTPNGDSQVDRIKVENVLEEWSRKPTLLTMTPPPTVPLRNASGSEIDSATESSENSVKTVVRRDNEPEDVPKKIEFFESIENQKRPFEKSLKKSKLSSSHSFADLKELFGETESARYATLPLRSHRTAIQRRTTSPGSEKGRSTSALPDVPRGRFAGILRREHEDNRPRSASPCRVSTSTGSWESIRHRSVSPDPERYWRAYLNLVKHGAVRRLREKFESLEDLSGDRIKEAATPKRFQSDPELTRNLLKRVEENKIIFKPKEVPDVAWLRRKYEPRRGRTKWRNKSPPIPRIPLRLEDLQMPHINVISKTVELKDSISRSSSMNSLAIKAETEELEAKKPVGRIRKKFEKLDAEGMSILGDLFTSAPDVHELRDISPYLAGKWVAHKYPSKRDNARSISLPPDLESGKGEVVRRKAATLPKRGERSKEVKVMGGKRPGSILKQPHDPFANQPFDPSKHRPRYRYQPPPPLPPAPNVRKAWWPPMPTYTARPTVTFEEYTNAPPPPPKTHQSRIDRPESPRRYVEGEVTIHYRSPVRTEAKEILSEEELARRSAENMRRVYQEERRRKYLQELHDIDSRRHTDNFTPSQKSPIPLNRYDDFLDDSSYRSRSQEQTPEPRVVARALYNFVGQTSRELSFRRGDIILIRRQIDKNWYEGEHNAMIGLFPLNYVEQILPYDGTRGTPKKSYEGQARAKFNFIAQTNLELSLAKGELVVLTRRVDENWFEGRVGSKKGIFPVTYVEVIVEPGQHRPETPVSGKPVASPAAHSMLSNGTASGKLSMGPHHYIPSIPVKTSTAEPQYISLPRIGVTERNKLHVAPVNETLHIDTHSDTLPYRALYNYRPQNEDELELREGDTVYVMEKCDDGWFVGSSQRSGYFGTFPGNYVERL